MRVQKTKLVCEHFYTRFDVLLLSFCFFFFFKSNQLWHSLSFFNIFTEEAKPKANYSTAEWKT